MDAEEARRNDWLLQGTTDPGEVAGRYDEWAESYDDDLVSWSYQAPSVTAEIVVTRVPDARSVLDVGCGTGLVGKALRARGCAARIVGLDISQASLRVAEQSDAYDSLERADLQQPLDVKDNAVDALVCAGVMTYLPDVEAVWREFARVVRPGGIVISTQREDLWEPRRCQEVIDRLETDGVWTPLDVSGPAPYLPHASGGMAGLGCYYLTTRIRS
jgi:predicted TPR repeat methyltransferase